MRPWFVNLSDLIARRPCRNDPARPSRLPSMAGEVGQPLDYTTRRLPRQTPGQPSPPPSAPSIRRTSTVRGASIPSRTRSPSTERTTTRTSTPIEMASPVRRVTTSMRGTLQDRGGVPPGCRKASADRTAFIDRDVVSVRVDDYERSHSGPVVGTRRFLDRRTEYARSLPRGVEIVHDEPEK